MDQLAEHDRRLSVLEKEQSNLRNELRIAEVRREHIDQKFGHIDERFNKLDQNISKLVWLVIAGIIGGFVSFVFSGGMNVVS